MINQPSPLKPKTRRRSKRLSQTADNDENIAVQQNGYSSANSSVFENTTKNDASLARTPLKRIQNNLVLNLKNKLEQQLSEKLDGTKSQNTSRTSPGLSNLRMTPGRTLREKQGILLRKHEEARGRAAESCAGGGVSIWPEMDNMRLTVTDVQWLVAIAVGLAGTVIHLFTTLHGTLLIDMTSLLGQLKSFKERHIIDWQQTEVEFNSNLLTWHVDFKDLLGDITSKVEVSLSQASLGYQFYIVTYVTGIGVLLYYLAENVLSSSKLTPRRIKIWVCLLVVMGIWTVLMVQLLVLAQAVEGAIENNVRSLNELLGEVLMSGNLNLTTYHNVYTYWQTRCLPPTTRGTLTVLGLMPVRDVTLYLQYYSLPVLTALVTPIIRLLLAVRRIYTVKPHK